MKFAGHTHSTTLAFIGLFAFAPALVFGGACAETTRTFSNNAGGAGGSGGSGGTTGSAGGGGSGGTTGQGGSAGSGGSGGGLPTECVAGMPPYAGPLCSGLSNSVDPCVVLADELVPSPPSFRNDAPGLGLDELCSAHAVYSIAEGGFKGYFAKRIGQNNWATESTPFEIATGGAAVGKAGQSYALVDNGAFGVTLFQRTPQGGWDNGHPINGKHHASARGLAKDENGFLHAAVVTDTSQVEYAFFDINTQAWSINPVGTSQVARAAVAVTPQGDAHFAYWNPVGNTWILHWRSPPQAAEQALPLNSGGLGSESQMQSITALPSTPENPTGVPHIAAVRQNSNDPQTLELVHTTRASANNWPVTVIDSPKTFPGDTCSGGPWPTQPGQKCTFDYEQIVPLGVVASQSGDISVIYNKIHRMGTMVSECFMPMDCFWKPNTDTSEGVLMFAAIGKNQDVLLSSAGSNIFYVNATVTLDRIGRIHILGYDAPPGQNGTTVRYMVLGGGN